MPGSCQVLALFIVIYFLLGMTYTTLKKPSGMVHVPDRKELSAQLFFQVGNIA